MAMTVTVVTARPQWPLSRAWQLMQALADDDRSLTVPFSFAIRSEQATELDEGAGRSAS